MTNEENELKQAAKGTYDQQGRKINDEERQAYSEDLSSKTNLDNASEEKEAESVDAKVKELEKENEELVKFIQRQKADFENYRKRTRQELAQKEDDGGCQVVKKLLPFLDNFERALAAEADEASFRQGMEKIFQQLNNILAEDGLTPVEAEGKPFDPNFHEAVMQVDSPDHDSNVVVEELQKGYSMNGKLLRASMVKVSK